MQEINEKFYKWDNHPKAYTVGDLKKIISELPDELPIKQGFGDGVSVVVYNYNMENDGLDCQLGFEENEED